MLALFSGKTYVRIANAWDVTDLPGTDGTGDRRYTAHWDFTRRSSPRSIPRRTRTSSMFPASTGSITTCATSAKTA